MMSGHTEGKRGKRNETNAVRGRICYLVEQSALHQGTPDPHQNLQF